MAAENRPSFAIKGIVGVTKGNHDQSSVEHIAEAPLLLTSPPVKIRWRGSRAERPPGTSSPLGSELEYPPPEFEPEHRAVYDLGAYDCQEATYGTNVKEMDPTRFLTNFDPHNIGITDYLRKEFLPGDSQHGYYLRAELCKLVIYSYYGKSDRREIPSKLDRFGKPQFGSLLVALPHEVIGELVLHHSGSETKFDWDGCKDAISFAAFSIDHEYKVEVTKGLLVLLIYNLYVAPLPRIESMYKTRYCK